MGWLRCLNLNIAHFQLPGLQAAPKIFGGVELLSTTMHLQEVIHNDCFVFALQLKYGS